MDTEDHDHDDEDTIILIVSKRQVEVKVSQKILDKISTFQLNDRRLTISSSSNVEVEELTKFNFEDVELEPFQDLLEYLCTKKLSWSGNLEELRCILTMRRLAQRFHIPDLDTQIASILDHQLMRVVRPETACQIFELARNFGVTSLKDRALELILKSPQLVFKNVENYGCLSAASFNEILLKDNLEISSELDLFHIVLSWGRSKCQSLAESLDDDEDEESEKEELLKNILSQVLPSIRFTQMTLQQFMDKVYPTEMLSGALLAKILPVLHKIDKEGHHHDNSPNLMAIENPRKYWNPFGKLPNEMLMEILAKLDNENLLQCRGVNLRFQEIIEEKFPLKISLGSESSLEKIGWLPPHSHPFRRIIVRIDEFTQLQKNHLLNFLSAAGRQSPPPPPDHYQQCTKIFLQLDIHLVPCHRTLMTFLERSSASLGQNLQVDLRVQRISTSFSYEGYSATCPFVQLRLVHFESILYSTEVRCLIDVVRNSPNLKKIIVGDFALRPKDCINAQFAKFIQSVDLLRDQEISCGNLELKGELTVDLFRKLKEEKNVRFIKVYFQDDWRVENLEFIKIFWQDLQEIYGLHVQSCSAPKLARSLFHLQNFPALTSLCVGCDPKFLLSILDKLPNLEKLIWSYFSLDTNNNTNNEEENNSGQQMSPAICLPKLTKFHIKIYRDGDLNGIKILAPCIENIKTFKCFNGCGCPINLIYDFVHLEELQLIQEGGFSVQDITGLKEAQLMVDQEVDGGIVRPPYIGNLKDLKFLNFGLLDYQSEAWSWSWELRIAALKFGIGHLKNLKEIIFPPIKVLLAKKILNFIASTMGQVKMVRLQVWHGPTPDQLAAAGGGGEGQGVKAIMTKRDVENFRVKYINFFEVKAIIVLQQDGIRHPVFC